MSKLHHNTDGFSAVEVLLVIVTLAVIGVAGYFVAKHVDKKTVTATTTASTVKPVTTTKTSPTTTPAQPANPYAGWQTYTDTSGSSFSMKYPLDWQVNSQSKTWAWTLTENANTQISVDARWTELATSTFSTPKDEWDNCPSLDACGHPATDTTLTSSTQTVNGFSVYTAKMQGSSGVYHVAVFKNSKQSSSGTSVFVELILYSDDSSSVNTYNQMVGSGTFST